MYFFFFFFLKVFNLRFRVMYYKVSCLLKENWHHDSKDSERQNKKYM